ncbi:MAG: DUF3574 domain-containing protein, partial [Pseudoxanthomonas sp.]
GMITEQEWTSFLEVVVTPRFPQGFSVLQAAGQWRSQEGAVVREASHVLQLAHTDDATSEQAITEIIATYKTRFHQESVLRLKATLCMWY